MGCIAWWSVEGCCLPYGPAPSTPRTCMNVSPPFCLLSAASTPASACPASSSARAPSAAWAQVRAAAAAVAIRWIGEGAGALRPGRHQLRGRRCAAAAFHASARWFAGMLPPGWLVALGWWHGLCTLRTCAPHLLNIVPLPCAHCPLCPQPSCAGCGATASWCPPSSLCGAPCWPAACWVSPVLTVGNVPHGLGWGSAPSGGQAWRAWHGC